MYPVPTGPGCRRTQGRRFDLDPTARLQGTRAPPEEDADLKRAGKTLVLGTVPYRVAAPVLDTGTHCHDVELVARPPAVLVEELRAGRLDGALVSSIEAFRTEGYYAAPDLGIAATGAVGSVRLFLRVPPAEVRRLAADEASRTSVALARIFLRRAGARGLTISTIPATRRPAAVAADAVLLIGDHGFAAQSDGLEVVDLGAFWYDWQRKPFVFALWLFRGPEDRARRALACVRAAAAAAPPRAASGLRVEHRLTGEHLAGLEAFRREAAAAGLCRPDVAPRWLAMEGEAGN